MKQYALEFSKYGVRFNGLNADRIKSGLLTKELILKRNHQILVKKKNPN